MSQIDELEVILERLEAHLDAVESGSLVGRDDLASVIHILVNKGDGFDLIERALKEIGAPSLYMPAFAKRLISRKYDGNIVHLAIRTVNITSSFTLTLEDMLKQEVVYHDNSLWDTSDSLNWSQLISKSRNKHGSHVDERPPKWLEDLRYYPAVNADVVTLLLWSFGEALLGAITNHLASNGRGVMSYAPRHSLNGIGFQEGRLAATSPTELTVAATVMATEEYKGNRTILGGTYDTQAFILGLDEFRRVTAIIGQPDVALEDIEHQFITGFDPKGLNRAQRRAARRK